MLAHYGLIALFLVALVKAIGVPIPIPADVLIVVAATGSASGKLVFWQAFAVLLVAMVVGEMIQFSLARGPGRHLLYRFGPAIGLTHARLDLAFDRVKNVGVVGIAVAVVTPGVRTAAIPACGLTTIPMRTFVAGVTLGTSIYLALQFFIAFAGVKLILRFWSSEPHAWLLLVLVPVAAISAWIFVRHQTRHVPALDPLSVGAGRVRSHRCPLCLMAMAAEAVLTRRAGEPSVALDADVDGRDGHRPVPLEPRPRERPVPVDSGR